MVALSGKTNFPQWPTDLIPLAEINAYLTSKGIALDEPVTKYDDARQVLRLIIDNT